MSAHVDDHIFVKDSVLEPTHECDGTSVASDGEQTCTEEERQKCYSQSEDEVIMGAPSRQRHANLLHALWHGAHTRNPFHDFLCKCSLSLYAHSSEVKCASTYENFVQHLRVFKRRLELLGPL